MDNNFNLISGIKIYDLAQLRYVSREVNRNTNTASQSYYLKWFLSNNSLTT